MKNNIKIYLIMATIVAMTSSCSRRDYIDSLFNENLNKAAIQIKNTKIINNVFYDTIKTTKNAIYKIEINLSSTDGLNTILLSGPGTLNTSVVSIEKGKLNYSIDYTPIDGTNLITIKLTNAAGETKLFNFNIFSFKNMLPVGNIFQDNSEKRLDFSSSYDEDKKFGGGILEYRVYVNDVLRKQDTDPYFSLTKENGFENSGSVYKIGLQCMDNDNEYGSLLEKTITLQ